MIPAGQRRRVIRGHSMRMTINISIMVLFCGLCLITGTSSVLAQSSSKGSETTGATGIKPLGSGEPIDYYNSERMAAQNTPSNLIQEQTPLATNECLQRVVPPMSTTAIPFVYDGQPQSINVAAGPAPTRLFVSTAPGYDPLNKMAQGAHADFVSPCHVMANIPPVCNAGVCTPDRDNENALVLTDISADLAAMGKLPGCVLAAGQTYYLNLQNQGKTPLCTSFAQGQNCAPCP